MKMYIINKAFERFKSHQQINLYLKPEQASFITACAAEELFLALGYQKSLQCTLWNVFGAKNYHVISALTKYLLKTLFWISGWNQRCMQWPGKNKIQQMSGINRILSSRHSFTMYLLPHLFCLPASAMRWRKGWAMSFEGILWNITKWLTDWALIWFGLE